jgi:anti-sigma factor RsiW
MIENETTPTARHADCEFAARVSAYHDGELPGPETREVAEHLADCPACASQLAFFGKVSGTFQVAPVRHLDTDARQRLEEMGEELQAERRRIKPAADVRWVRRLTAGAAILFVIAAGKVIYQQQSHPGAGQSTPAINPVDPTIPSREPVLEKGLGGSKSPAVTNTDYESPGQINGNRSSAPATGRSHP